MQPNADNKDVLEIPHSMDIYHDKHTYLVFPVLFCYCHNGLVYFYSIKYKLHKQF